MAKGYLALVLHAHLPYVRHPEHDDFLEEDWFYEAAVETYIPLLTVFQSLVRDGVRLRMTLSLSPTLTAMLTDPLLQDRLARYLNKLVDLSGREIDRTAQDPTFNPLARMYHQRFLDARALVIDRYGGNLVTGFRELMEAGHLDILTCGATHGYLPLMNQDGWAARGQIQTAVQWHEQVLGRPPRGIWLPECGYEPAFDEILKDAGLEYFVLDTHGLLHASPRPKYGVFAPIYTPNGLAVFGRDQESSKQVWSAVEGYPADPWYRDFYRDIGYDLDYDYIRPFLHVTGERHLTGIKYYRITGASDHKEPYRPDVALERAAHHAGNFMFNREKQVEYLSTLMDRKPIVIAPYDAELFGHWWFEGPDWINFLVRKIAHDQRTVELIRLSDYLDEYPVNQVSQPPMTSWGYKGYNEVWLNGSNDWLYRHLHRASGQLHELVDRFGQADGLRERALKQAARELLLAQASDWAFIMKTGTVVEYAVRRSKEHLGRFNRLHGEITSGQIDEAWLADVEHKDNLFPDIDYRAYASRE